VRPTRRLPVPQSDGEWESRRTVVLALSQHLSFAPDPKTHRRDRVPVMGVWWGRSRPCGIGEAGLPTQTERIQLVIAANTFDHCHDGFFGTTPVPTGSKPTSHLVPASRSQTRIPCSICSSSEFRSERNFATSTLVPPSSLVPRLRRTT
jgi:hypothetical protein